MRKRSELQSAVEMIFNVTHWPYMQDVEMIEGVTIPIKNGMTTCIQKMSKYSWENLSQWKTAGAGYIAASSFVLGTVVSASLM
jgi:hypothetical protein